MRGKGIALNTVQCKAILGQGFVGEVLVFLAKPQIEMNLRDRTPLLLIISSLSIVCLWLLAEECDLSLSREQRISSASLNFQIS
ncbi:uncharacterized protein [Malus domestica]|uniref:uncharacterized protein isoform X2 n=1 Tax=Malus domestica TaxID=3750 RepID=UPI00397600A9